MTRKANTATQTNATWTFTADSVILPNGNSIPARYSVNTTTKEVFIFTEAYEMPIRLHISPKMPEYKQAVAAAKAAETGISPKAAQAAKAAVKAIAQPKAEKPAKSGSKPAAQPKAEKPARIRVPDPSEWHRTEIEGNGWVISFDDIIDRTRVIFTTQPTAEQRAAIDEARFYWSNQTQSFNKKLTPKAYRAAMALAETLKALG